MKTFDKLHSEIKDYLAIKVPEVDEVKRLEIAGYILSLFVIREGDVLNERDKEWNRAIQKAEKRNEKTREFTIGEGVDKETLREEIRNSTEKALKETSSPTTRKLSPEKTTLMINLQPICGIIGNFEVTRLQDGTTDISFRLQYIAYSEFAELYREDVDIMLEIYSGVNISTEWYSGGCEDVTYHPDGSVGIKINARRVNPV